MNIGLAEIRRWHTDPKPEGNGWSDVGYHFIITRKGTIQEGRPLTRNGAHTRGHNHNTLGICLVGGVDAGGAPDANFTLAQYLALYGLVSRLRQDYPTISKISGHRDYDFKACPSFNVQALLSNVNAA